MNKTLAQMLKFLVGTVCKVQWMRDIPDTFKIEFTAKAEGTLVFNTTFDEFYVQTANGDKSERFNVQDVVFARINNKDIALILVNRIDD